MRKKASSTIKLVLITSVLASCGQQPVAPAEEAKQRVFMRADSTAPYTEVTKDYRDQHRTGGGMGSSLLWFMAFRHIGAGLGYSNNNLNPSSVSGTNAKKAAAYQAKRGGFGNTASSSQSSSFGS
ncbi:hypothetical protein MUK51_03615 [Sphingobacterium faecium]|uniref:hypothetical protein n=1 Tax=Sphingobacterium faecium TaxID=34087 RepID=UPI0021B598DE|nr:hypothetical protein [Sphingobacterium faecium]UXD70382.1 hypothetical protein MUK51_03615 [Sphingobacterium faecium]